ncbi:hypothetical protein BIY26_19540 [Brenneria goodwinii]|uniref:PGAP1-like protein n=1 Tax=Brenneria goodwinii TaxID=1109412 RepID=A0AAE8EQ57_9GAMM|nr:hypothetical protein [Brenneria goodwinii]ATA25247.1 hypothetical protein AWC36_14565 [Brenneria goodwinii]RLM17992.1 hypothetical protein BIY26_19540 [Brenneria goodwinii]
MSDPTKIIKIYPTFDKSGNAIYELYSYPKGSNIELQCQVYPTRVIPVFFIPGVMGSNLKAKEKMGDRVWRLDSLGGIALTWFGASAEERKRLLNPTETEVDDGGKVDESDNEAPLLQTRRQRGWGSVAYTSYAPFLAWLQEALNDFSAYGRGERHKLVGQDLAAEIGELALQEEEVKLSYNYLFPVFAVGYNWLESNAESARHIGEKITETINFYKRKGRQCEKAILVTHSMGGLVARHYSECLGGRDNVLGVVHGVMPATGAAATYRRMKTGTEYPEGDYVSWIAAQVLGGDGGKMTAVLSQAPGPMQLLPGRDYGTRWLKILDGENVNFYPKEDPYAEIYLVRDKWWGLCDERLISPGSRRTQWELNNDWLTYTKMLNNKVKAFIENLSGKYHPNTHVFYSAASAHPAYGDVCWCAETPAIEGRMNQGRVRHAADAQVVWEGQTGVTRKVATPLGGEGWASGIRQTYRLLPPTEAGDGTVPLRSGRIPSGYLRSRFQVAVEHEPAYQDAKARLFTLRAIVKIAQAVKHTTQGDG